MISSEYAAGFFVGEGCVNFSKRGRSRQQFLRVMITNTDPQILSDLQETFGGRLAKPRVLADGWKAFRQLILVGEEGFKFLRIVYPYLRLKKKQADLAFRFEFFRALPKSERCNFEHRPLPKMPHRIVAKVKSEVLEEEHRMFLEMKELNKKGKKK